QFDKYMPSPNQLHVRRLDVDVAPSDLLNTNIVGGKITEAGVRNNISVALIYMANWLNGVGCVPIHNLMEDAATAEISRSQLFQWVAHRCRTDDGQVITPEWAANILDEETSKLAATKKYPKLQLAKLRLGSQMNGSTYDDFLTTLCYDDIIKVDAGSRL
ncbi:hypothetical protein EV182_007872, partial [Spiromyces aspiralis]